MSKVKAHKGKLLAIDPGKRNGWALINIRSEKVLYATSLDISNSANSIVNNCRIMGWELEYLAIEGQYLDKNPQTYKKLIQIATREKLDWLIYYGGKDRIIEVHPKSWQSALGIPVKAGRKHVKKISMKMAILARPNLVDQDAADAINIGLYAVRHLKESMLKQMELRKDQP